MWLENYRWHYDYVRLAWDTGFSFGNFHESNFDKNKLILVDIEQIIRERDIASVERHISTIINYNLENERASVLDSNFVKVFRLSQLAVEYLLFCKKYLDNTVVLLKKDVMKLNQELQELKKYNGELENHVTVLSKHNIINTFKCDKCSKVFSTEDYLNSHIRRRHFEDSAQITDSETDKLHSEIKQLKERLNTTEKLLQEKTLVESIKTQHGNETNIADIQEKFNKFKEQVENEIANLQIQKTFYEEKYGKMFDIVVQCKSDVSDNTNKKSLSKNDKEQIENSTQTIDGILKDVKLENSTQTEEIKKNMTLETIQNISIVNPEQINDSNNVSDTHDYIDDKIEQKINDFGETVDSKISLGLENIEKHMQIFWEKLNVMENKQSGVIKVTPQLESSEKNELAKSVVKPVVKPRTKFTKSTKLPDKNESFKKAERLQNELNKILVESKKKSFPPVRDRVKSNSNSDSQIFPKKHKIIEVAKKSTTPTVRSSNTLIENVTSILELRLGMTDFRSDSKKVTEDTLKKALIIVNRHEDVKKKKTSAKSLPMKLNKAKKSKQIINKKEDNPHVIKIHYQKRTKDDQSEMSVSKPEFVSIKNRSLYDSDSESDIKKSEPQTVDRTQKAMITELKNLHAVNKSFKDDTDSDLTSLILSIDERPDTKSAFKSFRSESSLVKKKVLFDIENKENTNKGQTKVGLEKNYEENLSDFI